jgi:hypothetical protein
MHVVLGKRCQTFVVDTVSFSRVQNVMFDGTQNVAGQFLDSSDGFTFTRSSSAVITVQTSITLGGSSCKFDDYADAAIAAAQAQGVNPNTYDFRCVARA